MSLNLKLENSLKVLKYQTDKALLHAPAFVEHLIAKGPDLTPEDLELIERINVLCFDLCQLNHELDLDHITRISKGEKLNPIQL